jgi:acyl phosphate:glycerol-3-phosphate acyltransferase
LRIAVVIIIAYLLSSIPFGYLIVRAKQGADIRDTGSGGTGATNVSRRAGKAAGVITLMLDAFKGAAAIWIARVILESTVDHSAWWIAAAGVVAILGHMFPVWLGFRGGKGVATSVGVFLVLAPLAVVLSGVVFLIIVSVTRYISLGSIVAASIIPLLIFLQDRLLAPVVSLMPILIAAAVSAMLIVFAHRANIRRLLEGNENKFK